MFHNRNLSRRRHYYHMIMNNLNPTRPGNKLWFVFFVLFFFWYMLLYGFDWTSLPGLSYVSHQQDNSLQSSSSTNPIFSKASDGEIQETIIRKSTPGSKFDDVQPDRINQEKTLEEKETENAYRFNATVNDHVEEEEKSTVNRTVASTDDHKNKELEDREEPLHKKNPCRGRYIYVHDIPTRFNDDYIAKCDMLNKWHNMCQYFANEGLGQRLGNPQRLFLRSGWYVTHQFSLEVIFHSRMKSYECLTNDSSKAAAIYVPYYSGLDISRYLFDQYKASVKDADSLELFKWLRKQPEWDVMDGRDHFMVSGRITWDFRRVGDDDSEWGGKLMVLPESQNMTMVNIESSPWDKNDFAIPYPTYFHPSNDGQVYEWQKRMRRQRRKALFCFAGAPRPNMEGSIRGEIMEQCMGSGKKCLMMECKDEKHNCLKPAKVMKMFQSSTFCLQPPGDSFTRRSTFDSILAGCIPVFFTPASAYVQYLWHLPKNYESYSVLIPEGDVKGKKVSIESVLSKIPASKAASMREEVIKLIPSVIYADPRSRLEKLDDAFDLAITGITQRVEGLRREMRQGRKINSSDCEFDSESSWKYYTFGTTGPHEWDHYFRRY